MTNTPSDANAVYAAVGYAITQWGHFETGLLGIFSACIVPTSTIPHGGTLTHDATVPAAAFFAIENFRSKLALVDATLRARLDHMPNTEEFIERWSKIHNKARKFSKWRNRLAHWNVAHVGAGHKGVRGGVVPMPSTRSPAYHDSPPQSWRTANDLYRLSGAFEALSNRCSALSYDLASHPELHSRFAAIVKNQMENDAHCHNQSALEAIKRALSWPE